MASEIVIDASVTIAWMFNEDGAAQKFQQIFRAATLHAPELWKLEVANAVLVKERQKLITESDAAHLLERVDSLAVDVVSDPSKRTVSALVLLARPHQLTAYDAVYLELSMGLRLPLFTLDNNLRDAAKRVGVKLIAY